jgi:hypothetical protein
VLHNNSSSLNGSGKITTPYIIRVKKSLQSSRSCTNSNLAWISFVVLKAWAAEDPLASGLDFVVPQCTLFLASQSHCILFVGHNLTNNNSITMHWLELKAWAAEDPLASGLDFVVPQCTLFLRPKVHCILFVGHNLTNNNSINVTYETWNWRCHLYFKNNYLGLQFCITKTAHE